MAPFHQRNIVAQHLHSAYRPEEDADSLFEATFNTKNHAKMPRTPSSDPGFKPDLKLEEQETDCEEPQAPHRTSLHPQRPLYQHQIPGTFDHTSKNQRLSLTCHIKKFMKDSKANDLTPDQRWPMLLKLRESKLKEMEDMGKLTLQTHPDRLANGWIEHDDESRIRKHFASYLDGRTAGTSYFQSTATTDRSGRPVQRWDYKESSDEEGDDDQDDEEPDAPRIKREHLGNSEVSTPRSGATVAQIGLGVPAHLELIDGKAVSRSFCFRAMLNEANGLAAAEGMESVRKTWKWIDGVMVVWPAFDTESENDGRNTDPPRADSVVHGESKVDKQKVEEKTEASSSQCGPDEVSGGIQGIKRPGEDGLEGEEAVVKRIKIEAAEVL